jgi:hypothetical protein
MSAPVLCAAKIQKNVWSELKFEVPGVLEKMNKAILSTLGTLGTLGTPNFFCIFTSPSVMLQYLWKKP